MSAARIGAAAVVENGTQSWSLSGGREEQVIDNCEIYIRVQTADAVFADLENFMDRLARSTTSFATGSVVYLWLWRTQSATRGITVFDAFVEHIKKTPYLYNNYI